MAKNQSLPAYLQEKNSRGVNALLYSHSKRNDNGVAHSLAKNALCIPDFQVWMEDIPSHIGLILQLDVVEFY